jgi:hypothetical protein
LKTLSEPGPPDVRLKMPPSGMAALRLLGALTWSG